MAPPTAAAPGPHFDISSIPNNTHPSWWKDPGLRRLAICLVMGYCATISGGYDGSLIGGLFALPDFIASLGTLTASKTGLVGASLLLGILGAYPISPWLADRYGRRIPIFVGGCIVIGSAFMQTFTKGANAFIGGRVLMGFGAGLGSVPGTTYVTEIAHPRFRAQATGLATTTYFVGQIIASWCTFGTLNIPNAWSYKLPVILQAVPSAIQLCLLVFFCPESPRWLVSKGKLEEARAVLVRLHANGKEDDELVEYEFNEMRTAIEAEKEATAGISYFSFFKTKGNRKRLYILITLGLCQQWVGNGIISFYLPQILRTVNITSPSAQTGLNGGLSIWSWMSAIFGALMSERLGRRPLWFIGTIGMLCSYICITTCSAIFATKGTLEAGRATIAFIYLFNTFYAVSFTAIGQGLYPLEILPYGLRTKGFMLCGFTSIAAAFFNIYVNPIVLEAIAWKYYFVFIAVLVFTIVNIWFVYPETSRRTLEEVQALFDGPGAVEALVEGEIERHPQTLIQDSKKGEDEEQLEYKH